MSKVRIVERETDLGDDWSIVRYTIIPELTRLFLLTLRKKGQEEIQSRFDIDKRIFIDEPYDQINEKQRHAVGFALMDVLQELGIMPPRDKMPSL